MNDREHKAYLLGRVEAMAQAKLRLIDLGEWISTEMSKATTEIGRIEREE